jgi:hypothetical protein
MKRQLQTSMGVLPSPSSFLSIILTCSFIMIQIQLSSSFSLLSTIPTSNTFITNLSIHSQRVGRSTNINSIDNHDKHLKQLPLHILSLSNNNDFDDFSMEEVQAANELTKEFYQQIKLRQELSSNDSDDNNNNDNNNGDGSDETWEMKSNQSQPKSSTSSSKNRKFTGRFSQGDLDSTGTPSAGLFATQNGSVYAVPTKRPLFARQSSSSTTSQTTTNINNKNNDNKPPLSPRDKIMTQEFNILSIASNEITLLVQILFVSITLCFAIYIGVSGGITDGSDRFGGYEYDDMDQNDNSAVSSLIRNGVVDGGSRIGGDGLSITSIIEDSVKKEDSSSVWL